MAHPSNSCTANASLAPKWGRPRGWAVIGSMLALLASSDASARSLEPGTVLVSGQIGPAFRLGSALGASDVYATLGVGGEYVFDANASAVADLNLSLAGTVPLRLHLGGRYRFDGLGLPVAPYAQAQLSLGKLFDVLGADLALVGARLAIGADYYLTSELGAGVLLGSELTTTRGERPAFFGVVDVLLYASYVF